jgi:hypothetical protein
MESSPDTVRELVQSSRRDIAQGAAELRVDDFVDTFLRESHPEDALAAPSRPEPPTVPRPGSQAPRLGAPMKTVKMQALAPPEPSGTMMMPAVPEAQPLPRSAPPQARIPTPMPPTLPAPTPGSTPPALAGPSSPSPYAPQPTYSSHPPGLIPPAPAAARKPSSRAPLVVAVGVAVLMACGGIALLVLGPKPEPRAPTTTAEALATAAATSTSTAPHAAPAATATAQSASGASTVSEAASDTATAAPSEAASETAPPTTASSAPSPTSVEPSSEPAAGLLSFQAYLTVESTAGLDVVVQGVVVGQTNEKNLVRCGPRNVRLREPKGGRFRTAGQAAQLSCMKHVTLSLAADP